MLEAASKVLGTGVSSAQGTAAPPPCWQSGGLGDTLGRWQFLGIIVVSREGSFPRCSVFLSVKPDVTWSAPRRLSKQDSLLCRPFFVL